MSDFEIQVLDELSKLNEHILIIRGAIWCVVGVLLCMGCFKWR